MSDIAILDNSAVTVDYLKYDKPFLLTDLFSNQVGARADKPLINHAAQVIDHENIDELKFFVGRELMTDSFGQERARIRNEFIGQYEEGESTRKFIDEIRKVIETRDSLVKQREEMNL